MLGVVDDAVTDRHAWWIGQRELPIGSAAGGGRVCPNIPIRWARAQLQSCFIYPSAGLRQGFTRVGVEAGNRTFERAAGQRASVQRLAAAIRRVTAVAGAPLTGSGSQP